MRHPHLINDKILVIVNIFYWMPDYEDIIQEFIWQTKDTQPTYPRVNKFLLEFKNADIKFNFIYMTF